MSDPNDILCFECGSCGATYTGKPHELAKLGWVSHYFKAEGMRRPNGEFLMCAECEEYYARRRKMRKQLKEAA